MGPWFHEWKKKKHDEKVEKIHIGKKIDGGAARGGEEGGERKAGHGSNEK